MDIRILCETVITMYAEVDFGTISNSVELAEKIIHELLKNNYKFVLKDENSGMNLDDFHDSLACVIASSSETDLGKVWNTDVLSKCAVTVINKYYTLTNN